jgi:hypothetical protein
LKTANHPDNERRLYCQQLYKRDSQSTDAEKLFSPLKPWCISMPIQIPTFFYLVIELCNNKCYSTSD